VKIIRVEPTPSPNSMKLTLDERLNPGVRLDYKQGEEANAPAHIRKLLQIPGVTGVFQTGDFLALERHPKGDWRGILAAAEGVLGVAEGQGGDRTGTISADGKAGSKPEEAVPEKAFGEVGVLVQTFRGIPMQVRVSAGLEEKRAAMPQRFLDAASVAGLASPNLIMERKLEDRGVRYGELAEVLEEIVKELDAAYDDARLQELVARSHVLGGLAGNGSKENLTDSSGENSSKEAAPGTALSDPDWRKRYAALERLKPGTDTIPVLMRALKDENTSVRRLAVVYMGDIREEDTLPYLLEALKDSSPIIRRTAGDTLSDRGDPKAAPAMEEALSDSSKLVRWRAARFLYEAGDESSLPSLLAAKDDPEFEIRLQVRLAIERIQGGEAAQGTVWQQMTRRNEG
jgi:hypothetical protein